MGELFVRIRADSAGFRQEASGPIAAAGRDLSKVFLAAFAVGGIATTIAGVVKAATSHQAAFAVLNQTIKDSGAANELYGQSIESLLEKEARLKGFHDEDLASAFQRLISVTHDTSKAYTDLGLAEDLARFRHIDLATAALALSKVEQGSFTALQRYGIVVPKVTTAVDELTRRRAAAVAAGAKFTATDKELYATALKAAQATDKQATAAAGLALVQQRTAGAAATFAQTASGQFQRLQQDFHQFEVAIGTPLLGGLAGAAEGLGSFFTHLTQSGEAGHVATTAAHDFGVVLHDLGAVAEAVGPPLLTVAKAAVDVVDAVGAPALLTAVATYKAVGIAIGLAATAEEFYARVLLANQGVTLAATAENAALADSYDAVALSSALAAGERGIGSFASGLATLGAGAVASPAGIAIGVTALAAGIVYLVTQEDSWTAANHRLTGSIGGLTNALQQQGSAQGAFAKEAAAENRAAAIEKVAAALGHLGDVAVQKTLPPLDPIARGISQINTLSERSALSTGKNAAAVETFTHAVGEQILALGKSQPLLAHQLELAGELAVRLGRPPSKQQFDLILNTATAKESLDQFLADIVGVRPDFAAAGFELGSAFSAGFRGEVGNLLGGAGFLTGDIAASVNSAITNQKIYSAGASLLKSLRDGIASDQTDIASIQQQLQDAVAQGVVAVDQAVQQAKQNLNTIGQSLAQSIALVLEKPITDAQARLTAKSNQLGVSTARQTLTQLGESVLLPGGRNLSRDPEQAIAQLKKLAAAAGTFGKPAIENFLSQYEGAVSQLSSAQLAVRQTHVSAVTTAIQQRLADLTDEFNKGAITAAQLERRATNVLVAHGITRKRAVTALGVSGADLLSGQVQGLALQAGALAAGPQRPGAGLVPSITSPLDTVNQTNRQIAQLQQQRDAKQLDESKKHTQLLKKIAGERARSAFTSSLQHNPGGASKTSKALTGVSGG